MGDFAGDVGEAIFAALKFERQLFVVDAEQMQHRRVKIIDVHRILNDVKTDVVGLAVGESSLDAAARHPDGEGVLVMVTADFVAHVVRSSQFPAASECGRTQHPRPPACRPAYRAASDL